MPSRTNGRKDASWQLSIIKSHDQKGDEMVYHVSRSSTPAAREFSPRILWNANANGRPRMIVCATHEAAETNEYLVRSRGRRSGEFQAYRREEKTTHVCREPETTPGQYGSKEHRISRSSSPSCWMNKHIVSKYFLASLLKLPAIGT